MYRFQWAIVGLSTLLTAACARYEPDIHLSSVSASLESRTGETLPQFTPASSPLSGEITPALAARMALQHNPNLQATLEELNVATAQEVQAGLLINPTIDGLILFEENGVQPMLEFGLAFNLGRLLTRGRRMKLATSERERIQAETIRAIVQAMAEARAATLAVWAANKRLGLLREIVTVRQSAARAAQILSNAGNLTAGDLAMYRRMLTQSQIALGQATLTRIDALETLSNATGRIITNDASAVVNPATRPEAVLEATFIQTALDNSLLLEAERQRIKALGVQVGLADVSVWLDHLETEAVFEREEGETSAGFGAGLSLPVLDSGQARTGAAKAALKAAEMRYRALAFSVANRARAILGLLAIAKTASTDLTPTILTTTDDEFDFQARQMNAMQIGPLGLLAAKAQQLENQLAAVDLQQLMATTRLQADALEAGIILTGVPGTGMQAPNTSSQEAH